MNSFIEVTDTQSFVNIYSVPLIEVVAFITIIGLLINWYFAIQARKDAERARILNSLPIIIIELSETENKDSILLKNIGKTAATNIRIDNFYQPTYDDVVTKSSRIMKLKFVKVGLLMPNLVKDAEAEVEEFGLIDANWLKYKIANAIIPLSFNVRYEDLSGVKYLTRIRILKGIADIEIPPVKFTITRRVAYWFRMRYEFIYVNAYARYKLQQMVKDEKNKKKS